MGKNIHEFVKNVKCSEGLEGIITVEHRTNNEKRDFIFCNKLQGKHIPVNPSEAFDLFDELAYQVNQDVNVSSSKIMVVGFAETATAIGAFIANALSNAVFYIQTTREDCSPIEKLIEFKEEHSHATEQIVYGELSILPEFDYILFVDDEISTGKTILNFIEKFSKIKEGVHFGVASICNWQSMSDRNKFKEHNIGIFSLISGELINVNAKMNVKIKNEGNEFAYETYRNRLGDIAVNDTIDIHGEFFTPFIVERTGRHPLNIEYKELIKSVVSICSDNTYEFEKILILGTEEFMYFPMAVGDALESLNRHVYVHATTRSSIDVIDGGTKNGCDILSKFKLHSAYDTNRETYIYNLKKYDRVFIISDGEMNNEFKKDILYALISQGNNQENITFIRLVK